MDALHVMGKQFAQAIMVPSGDLGGNHRSWLVLTGLGEDHQIPGKSIAWGAFEAVAWRKSRRLLQDFHGVIVPLETLSNPSFDLVELCGILECAKGSIEFIVTANGLQGSPISRVELQQSVLGGGGGVRTDK